jgi:hypothetical protein
MRIDLAIINATACGRTGTGKIRGFLDFVLCTPLGMTMWR